MDEMKGDNYFNYEYRSGVCNKYNPKRTVNKTMSAFKKSTDYMNFCTHGAQRLRKKYKNLSKAYFRAVDQRSAGAAMS
jgi:hypothetical protein